MSTPRLSICIPTWNRAAWLRQCLTSIADQYYELDYEVCVQDNASTDGTDAVFQELASGRQNWRYTRNNKNLGGISNIRLCTESASAPYIFILGSDDTLVADAFPLLDELLNLASASNAGAIFSHNTTHSTNCWRLSGGFDWLIYAGINVPAFISSVVWRAEVWREKHYCYDPKSVYTLPHLGFFVETCATHNIIACSRSLVTVGHADREVRFEDNGLYCRWPLMDCFEYPELYYRVLSSDHLDYRTRSIIQLRRLAHMRHIPKKIAIILYNWHYFFSIIYRDQSLNPTRPLLMNRLLCALSESTVICSLCALYCERIIKIKRITGDVSAILGEVVVALDERSDVARITQPNRS